MPPNLFVSISLIPPWCAISSVMSRCTEGRNIVSIVVNAPIHTETSTSIRHKSITLASTNGRAHADVVHRVHTSIWCMSARRGQTKRETSSLVIDTHRDISSSSARNRTNNGNDSFACAIIWLDGVSGRLDSQSIGFGADRTSARHTHTRTLRCECAHEFSFVYSYFNRFRIESTICISFLSLANEYHISNVNGKSISRRWIYAVDAICMGAWPSHHARDAFAYARLSNIRLNCETESRPTNACWRTSNITHQLIHRMSFPFLVSGPDRMHD